jgi:AraC-like DNA-binding protein
MVFNDEYRRTLSCPGKWKIVSSLFPPDHSRVNSKTHGQWLKTNSDKHLTKEMLLVFEGVALNSLNRLIYPATAGTVFMFDAYEEHDKSYSKEIGKAVHLWFSLGPNRIFVRLLKIRNGRIEYERRILNLEKPELCNAFIQGWGSLKDSPLHEKLKKMKLKALLSLLFLELIEQDIIGEKDNYDSAERQTKIIQMILQHISDTAGRGLTVDKLARIAGYSKFHFLRFFKKHTGQKVHDCINAARIVKIKDMLKGGSLQKEISEELGFSCPSAFSNWYRKRKSNIL